MAVSFVNNALGGTADTTSFSITLPATQSGDIIILEYTHRGTGDATLGGTYSGPAFAEKHDQQYASSTFSGKTCWSRATGDHNGQTVTGSGLTNSCAAIITIYRGALAAGDPLAAATIVGEQNASANETQAEITTLMAGAWVVLVVVNSPDLAVSSQSCTTPGALTERAERLSTGGTDTSIAHASAEKAAAGATGAFTWTQSDAASGSWAYAIQPEPRLDDDENAWWSGPNGNGVGAPIAGAAAALALSVAIATGFNQPVDDIVPQPPSMAEEDLWQVYTPPPVPPLVTLWQVNDERPFPPTLSGHEEWRVIAVGESPPGHVFSADEEFVPPLVLSEGEWAPPVPVVVAAVVSGPQWDDQALTWLRDEGTWEPRWLSPPLTIAGPLWDDQTPAWLPDDAYEWTAWLPVAAPVATAFSADEEIAPQAAAASSLTGSETWQVVAIDDGVRGGIVVADEEIVPQPPFRPVEDYWLRLVSDPVAVEIVELPGRGPGDGQAPAAASAGPPTEDYWLQLVADPVEVAIVEWPGRGAGWVIAGSAATEEYWLQLPARNDRIVAQVFSADEVLPQGVPGGPAGWAVYGQRKRHTPEIRLWEFTDELPIPPVPLPIIEAEWQVYTPPPLPKQPLYLPDREEISAGVLVVITPVYGWGARGGVGRDVARDPWQRIGSETARDPWQRIGSETASSPTGKIGEDDA